MLDEDGSTHPGSWDGTMVSGLVYVDVGSPLGIHVALVDGARIIGTDTTSAASTWKAGRRRSTTGMYMFTGVRPGSYELVFSLSGQEIARETVVVDERQDTRRESSLRIAGIRRTPRCA